MKITIGSRGSKLALWQAEHIADRLRGLGAEVRIEVIKTTGDKIQDVPLAKVGGKGLFTKEIEEALLAGTVDVAVHSMKDMPTDVPDGLVISAIPEREEPRDALIGTNVAGLRVGMKIGTSSLRRSAQLRAHAPGLVIENLRGNLDTRLRKLDEGQYDAIVLAAAGLRRLGWADRIQELIPPEVMCPAVGQGALAIETREDGGQAHELVLKLNDAETRACVTAERAFLAVLGGGCQVPIGAHARLDGETLHLEGLVASPDGREVLRERVSGRDPQQLGRELGQRILEQGARRILDDVYAGS